MLSSRNRFKTFLFLKSGLSGGLVNNHTSSLTFSFKLNTRLPIVSSSLFSYGNTLSDSAPQVRMMFDKRHWEGFELDEMNGTLCTMTMAEKFSSSNTSLRWCEAMMEDE